MKRLVLLIALPLMAQQDGYMARLDPKPGAAPKAKVTEFTKSARSFELVLSKGDEIIAGVTEFAEKHNVKFAHFTGVGAVDKAAYGWFDPEKRAYKTHQLNEEAEIVNFTGNITTGANGKPAVHGHITFALQDGSAKAGHLLEGYISLTLQLFIDELTPVAK